MATSRNYDVLLLDFGGVCLLNPVELHHRTESALGLDPGTLDWLGPVDPNTDPLWRRMIAGDGFSERDYWAERVVEIGRLAGRDLSVRDYMTIVFEPPTPDLVRPEAMSTVTHALAAGYGVSVLTNDMRAFHGTEWEHEIDLLQLVDHIVDLSDSDVLKPDPRAFSKAIDAVGAPVERILFVDDQPINVQGAEKCGLESIWFDISRDQESWADVALRLGLRTPSSGADPAAT